MVEEKETNGSLEKNLAQVEKAFESNCESIKDLMDLDDIVVRICIRALEAGRKQFEIHGITNGLRQFEQELGAIKNIRTKGNLRPYYTTMLSQCVVLLVSYFASAIEDLFCYSIEFGLKQGNNKKLNETELKLSVSDWIKMNIKNVGEIIVSKEKISFQDMKSISRAFEDYLNLNLKIEKGRTVDNIILGMACRHTIVHSGGIVGNRTMGQISSAPKRTLKPDILLGDKVEFNNDEIKILIKSMTDYVKVFIDIIKQKITKPSKNPVPPKASRAKR